MRIPDPPRLLRAGRQPVELVLDAFAGGGGASTGMERALGFSPDYAVNHDAEALAMHAANHPETIHMVQDVWDVDPFQAAKGRRIGLAWFSPDCRHFSRAKGSAPKSASVRALAGVVVRWAGTVRPRVMFVENVPEFTEWGPLDAEGRPIKAQAGRMFRNWVYALHRFGYRVEWRVLDAAAFGVPTHRRRLYLVARCDGQPIEWPEPTHGPGLEPYRPASSIIDWSIPGRSIFGRKRDLAENTHRRIANGLRRFVVEPKRPEDAFIVRTGHYNRSKPTTFRGQTLDRPLGTVCAQGNDKALVMAWVAQYFGGMTGKPMGVPLPTVTATDHNALACAELVQARVAPKVDHVRAWLLKYYGTAIGQSLNSPVHTLTTRARMGLVELHGQEYQIVDITLRMLEPHELAAAQGFPKGYKLLGTKRGKIARIGNSVVPRMAQLLVDANR